MSYDLGASRWRWGVVAIGCALISVVAVRAEAAEQSGAKPYVKVSGVSGNLTCKGSDTLGNLMTMWAEEFGKLYPNVKPQIEAKGSATAPPALAEGTALFGPMSRKMKPEEEEAIEAKRGVKPTRIDVALDCLTVYVHKDNPIHGLTLDQLDSVFSKTYKRGYDNVSTWGQVGLTDTWAGLPMSLYGRNSASGTYGYFKEHVLQKGDFKDSVKEQPGSAAVVNGIAKDRAGIGYSGLGYKTSEVRAVALAKTVKEKLTDPTYENAIDGSYPLGRTLYVYVVKKPDEPWQPLVQEFIKFVLAKEGQEVVVKDGYGALPPKLLEKNLKIVE